MGHGKVTKNERGEREKGKREKGRESWAKLKTR